MFIEKLKQFNLVNPAWIQQDGVENVNRFQYRLTYGQWPPEPRWLSQKIPAKLDVNGTMKVFELTPDIINDYVGRKAPKSVMEYKIMKADEQVPNLEKLNSKMTVDEVENMQKTQANMYKQQQVALMQQMQYMQKLQQMKQQQVVGQGQVLQNQGQPYNQGGQQRPFGVQGVGQAGPTAPRHEF